MPPETTQDSTGKKDPIKEHEEPLRYPGQSVDEAMDNYEWSKIGPLIAAAGIVAVPAAWWFWFTPGRLHPVHVTIAAAIVVPVSLWLIRKRERELRTMRLGSRGEKVVGQMLEDLRASGYSVFHDIPGDGFNVDHVLIGPAGVFAIETKTLSKPKQGSPEIAYDGSRVIVPGVTLDRDPLTQSRASADHIRDIIERTTGWRVQVRPVVVFWGWYVQRQPRGVAVWVLSAKALPTFVANEPSQHEPSDVRRMSEALAMYVRNYGRK
jgi:hypothetical protein